VGVSLYKICQIDYVQNQSGKCCLIKVNSFTIISFMQTNLCVFLTKFVVSFFNWETQTSASNPTPNYQVIAENATGLLFKNKRDRKILNVDPKVRNKEGHVRYIVRIHGSTELSDYLLCVICLCRVP